MMKKIAFWLVVSIIIANTLICNAVSSRVVSAVRGEKRMVLLYSDGTAKSKATSAQDINLSNVKAVAAGFDHFLALLKDGTVWAWGTNESGQLGDGTTDQKDTAVKVQGLNNIVEISAGFKHNVALKADGTVWVWGGNCSGQLGDGTTEKKLVPVQVKSLKTVKFIAAGFNHTIAVKEDGNVWVWGSNLFGQLGNGKSGGDVDNFDSGIDESTPIQVNGMFEVKKAAGGWQHTVILKNDGTVWGWGHNIQGQLGNGTISPVSLPAQAKGLSNITAIFAGGRITAVVKDDGTLWKCGDELSGLNGNAVNERPEPFQVEGINGVTAVSGNMDSTIAVRNDGTIWEEGADSVAESENSGEITLQVNSPTMFVNNTEKEIDPGLGTTPVIEEQRTLLPVRTLIETLGGTVAWNADEKKVTIQLKSKTIELKIGSTKTYIDGVEKTMDVPPKIMKNRTMVPLRYVIENLGYEVKWDSSNQKITIVY